MQNMHIYAIYVHMAIQHMHIVLGAFLKHSQISVTFSVLVLQLAVFRTCYLAQLVCHV